MEGSSTEGASSRSRGKDYPPNGELQEEPWWSTWRIDESAVPPFSFFVVTVVRSVGTDWNVSPLSDGLSLPLNAPLPPQCPCPRKRCNRGHRHYLPTTVLPPQKKGTSVTLLKRDKSPCWTAYYVITSIVCRRSDTVAGVWRVRESSWERGRSCCRLDALKTGSNVLHFVSMLNETGERERDRGQVSSDTREKRRMINLRDINIASCDKTNRLLPRLITPLHVSNYTAPSVTRGEKQELQQRRHVAPQVMIPCLPVNLKYFPLTVQVFFIFKFPIRYRRFYIL